MIKKLNKKYHRHLCFSCISYLSFGIEIAAETKPQPCYILLKIDFKRDIIRAKI